MLKSAGAKERLECIYLKKSEIVTSWSHGYRDVTAKYIHRAKIPSHIYAKYHTGKNQSTKVHNALYIPT